MYICIIRNQDLEHRLLCVCFLGIFHITWPSTVYIVHQCWLKEWMSNWSNELMNECISTDSFLKRFVYFIFRQRGREGERERERKSMCGCLSHAPYWAPGPKPRHVPGLGIEVATLWFTGQRSFHWATPARASTNSFQRTKHRANHWGNPEVRGRWKEKKYACMHAHTCVCVWRCHSWSVYIYLVAWVHLTCHWPKFRKSTPPPPCMTQNQCSI